MTARDAILEAVRRNRPTPAVDLPDVPMRADPSQIEGGVGYSGRIGSLAEVGGFPDAGEPLAPYFRDHLEAMGGRSFEVADAEAASAKLAELFPGAKVVCSATGEIRCSGNGILGSALPMAVGVKLARAQSPVVCVLGDGATQYSVQGFWTAAREKLPIVFLVMDNAEYAILKAFADYLHTPGVPGLDLGAIDFAGLAAGYGLADRPVDRPDLLATTLQGAFGLEGPSLVHVRIDPAIPPLIG